MLERVVRFDSAMPRLQGIKKSSVFEAKMDRFAGRTAYNPAEVDFRSPTASDAIPTAINIVTILSVVLKKRIPPNRK